MGRRPGQQRTRRDRRGTALTSPTLSRLLRAGAPCDTILSWASLSLPSDPKRPFRLRPSWLSLAALVVLALGMSWPLVANLSSRVPGTATWAFDESTFLWNDWYFKHALLDLHANPLHSELIWHPLGIDLILHTYNFFNAADRPAAATGLQSAPGEQRHAAGVDRPERVRRLPAGALRSLLRRRPAAATGATALRSSLHLAAFLAGVIYAFGSNRAVYMALGHYNIATTQWIPFFALYLLRTLHRPGLKNAALAGLFFALAALAEMTWASLLALLGLILVAALWRTLEHRRRVLVWLAFAGLVAALLWSPVLAPVTREFLTGEEGVTGWGESVKLSADLVGLVTPTDLNPVLGSGARRERIIGRPPCGWLRRARAVSATSIPSSSAM